MSESPKPPPKPPKPTKQVFTDSELQPPEPPNKTSEQVTQLEETILSSASANAASEADTNEITSHVQTFQISDKSYKDLDAILAADSEDESLRKYKEALLGSAAHGDRGDVSDPRRLVIVEYRVMFAPEEGLADIVHQLDSPQGLKKLEDEGITLREGVKFKFRISFKVQHDIIVGVKFVNKLSKLMFTETEELNIGSYPPSSQIQVFEFPKWEYNEAPRGMLYRGDYRANNTFVDSDGTTHLRIDYSAHIVKA